MRDHAETAFDTLIGQSGMDVEKTSLRESAKIESAGNSVKAAPAPVGQLAAPAHLSATMGDREGECYQVWNPVRGTASCVIQVADAGGSRHWFRVAALGTAGQGPWSDPATAVAA